MAERFFNTSGPVVPADHYCVPPLERFDLEEILRLIRAKRYFVLHAPRQTGKTSALLALRDLLNAGDEYRCVYANIETAQTARGDVARGMKAILHELRIRTRIAFADGVLEDLVRGALEEAGADGALREVLVRWSTADARPLVLLLDEIDALVGDTLISVLRQLRAGYDQRPAAFPQSVILCGIRDVRDYRIHSESAGEIIAGGSAFNVKAKSLRLGDFSEADVRALLGQHTEETGQEFTEGALAAVWNLSRGQPWLVNALAYQACFEDRAGRGPLADDRRGGDHGGQGGTRPEPPDAPSPVGGQAPGGAGAARDRAGPERPGERVGQGQTGRRGVRPRPGPAGASGAAQDRQPDLPGSDPAGASCTHGRTRSSRRRSGT